MILVFGPDGKATFSYSSAQYTGDKYPGQHRHWQTYDPDANAFVRYSYGELSKRCATLYHTSAIARACINKPRVYAIGDGIYFRSAIDHEFLGLTPTQAKDWSRRFSELLNLEKVASNYYEKSGTLFCESGIFGDALLLFLREEESELPFDPIVTGGHHIQWQKSNEDHVLGIHVDEYMRRKGFVDNRGNAVDFVDSEGNQNAVMFFLKERAGQIRGYSRYYSEIGRSKSFDRMWDATVERMVQEAVHVGYYNVATTDINAQMRRLAEEASGKTPDGGMKQVHDERALTPGAMYTFANGEGMTFNDVKSPSNNFGLANEWTINMFAMATGYAPEFLLSKYSTSYTAHKGALNDTYKRIMQERVAFIRAVEMRVNMEYLKHFARTGQLDVRADFWSDYKVRLSYLAGTYVGPVPGHVNPLQEINADLKAEGAGLVSKEALAAKWGTDFWKALDEMQAQIDAWNRSDPETQEEQLAADLQRREDGEAAAESKSERRRWFGRSRR